VLMSNLNISSFDYAREVRGEYCTLLFLAYYAGSFVMVLWGKEAPLLLLSNMCLLCI